MRKKLFTVLMCAVLVMSLTAGCGNSGGTEGDGQPEQSQEQETEKEEEALSEEEQKADAFSEDIKRCLDCGMNAHVAKPIDVQEVARLLEKFIFKKE